MNKPIEVRVLQGGQLASDISGDSVPMHGYSEKRDWRRRLDVEVRSEGHDVFRPNPMKPPQKQCCFAGEDIILKYEARLPSGVRSYIAATATTIYALDTLDNGPYFDPVENLNDEDNDGNPDNPVPYFDSDYFDENPSEWRVVGRNFNAPNGWQAVTINGFVFLNNTFDLPVTYQPGDLSVKPVYELREIGVASVSSIADLNGFAMLGGIRQLRDADIATLWVPVSFTGSQVGAYMSTAHGVVANDSTVTSTGNQFTADHVGKTIRFPNGFTATILSRTSSNVVVIDRAGDFTLPFIITGGASSFYVDSTTEVFKANMVGRRLWLGSRQRIIREFISTTRVRVNHDGPVGTGVAGIIEPDAYQRWEGPVDNFAYRELWSDTARPRQYAASGSGTISAGSSSLLMATPMLSLEPGETILIAGAGVDGGVHETSILQVFNGGKNLSLNDPVVTSVADAVVMRKENFGSISSYRDIQDDGSGIVAQLKTKNSLVIYRETSIFTCVYTGRALEPFDFRIEYGGTLPGDRSLCLRYPQTLISIDDSSHLFCGANDFVVFDSNSRRPKLVEALRLSSRLVFRALESGRRVFSCNNELTNEVWVSIPEAPLVYRIDYRTAGFTVSTSPIKVTSGNTMTRPPVTDMPNEKWFVMGVGDVLATYGLTDSKELDSGDYAASQSGNAVIGTGGLFSPAHVGRSIVWDSGEMSYITEYTDSNNVSAIPYRTVNSGAFRIIPMHYCRFRDSYTSLQRSGLNAFGTTRDEKHLVGYGLMLKEGSSIYSQHTKDDVEVEMTGRTGVQLWLGLEGVITVGEVFFTIASVERPALPEEYTVSGNFIKLLDSLTDVEVVRVVASTTESAPRMQVSIATKRVLNKDKSTVFSKSYLLDSQWIPTHYIGRYFEDTVEVYGAHVSAELVGRAFDASVVRSAGLGMVNHGS